MGSMSNVCKVETDRFVINSGIVDKQFRVLDRYIDNINANKKSITSLKASEDVVDYIKRCKSISQEIETNLKELQGILKEQKNNPSELSDQMEKENKLEIYRNSLGEKRTTISLLEEEVKLEVQKLDNEIARVSGSMV